MSAAAPGRWPSRSPRRGAEVVGVDGDPEVLALARAKPGAEAVQWRKGRATALPLPGASADRVVMSLLLHHLDAGAKRRRWPRRRACCVPAGACTSPTGGARATRHARGGGALQRVDGPEGLRENLEGACPALLADAGFAAVAVHDRLRTAWGSLELLSALRP